MVAPMTVLRPVGFLLSVGGCAGVYFYDLSLELGFWLVLIGCILLLVDLGLRIKEGLINILGIIVFVVLIIALLVLIIMYDVDKLAEYLSSL